MLKILSFLLIILVFSLGLNAEEISHENAKTTAKNFYYQRINQFEEMSLAEINVSKTEFYSYNNNLSMYIFKMNPKGYVIVSAESNSVPVLAYGFKEKNEQKALAFEMWLENYAQQIEIIRSENIEATAEIESMWTNLLDEKSLKIFNSKSVQPLLLSNWNQDARYNQFCPEDEDGPGGRAYAGCVATAMSQHMYYFKFPRIGTSQNSYVSNNYGFLSADFSAANYKYEEMVKKIQGRNNPALAELMYHCGISVNMNYSAVGSGAMMYQAAISMKSHFNYSTNTNLSQKNTVSDALWISKIVSNLDNKIPIIYAGYPSNGAGHAFNLDGYQGSDFFHFNWGWGGSYDGYFYITALNPASNNFSFGQNAIFDAFPQGNYPDYCDPNTINVNSTEGSFDDGSGPVNDYLNNSNCKWLINPSIKVEYIKLTFDYFKISDASDYIVLYDGSSTTDSIIDTVDINNYSSTFFSSGQNMLVEFISNGNSTGEGWHLSYTSKDFKYCSGNEVYTDAFGSFGDGSDSSDYMNNTYCNWYIKPNTNPEEIKLNFSKFDLESNKDFLRIYDPTTMPSTLLASYSGNKIPASVSAFNGEMLILFTSNDQNPADGFQAHYVSGPLGVESDFKEDFKIFPNPANDRLFIETSGFNLNNLKIEVYNQNGKLVLKQNIENSEYLDISNLQKAVYILKINDIHTYKLVKI